MDQKQRNKIVWILIAVFVPLLIILLATNIAKVRTKKDRQVPPVTAVGGPAGAVVLPPVQPIRPETIPVDPKILAEQKRIATLLPASNPFNPARPVGAEAPAVTAAPLTPVPVKAPVAVAPPAAGDSGIRLTAIISRQGGTGRAAMINGCLYGVGDNIAGWTIRNIDAREVLMQNGTRQMVLRLK